MKITSLAPFALIAALSLTGCGRKDPPSNLKAGGSRGGDSITTGPSITQDAPGTDLENRGDVSSKIAGWDGDVSKLPADAILVVVHFGFDRYSVESAERAKIDAAASGLKGKKILAAGYCDHFGTEEYNLGLSDKRAHSVQSYLGGIGVNDTDIRAFGSQHAAKSGDKNAVAGDRKVVIIDANKIP